MALPRPVPGLVVRYVYLWRREHLEGREEGRKDRPCAILYGMLPPSLFAIIRRRFLALVKAGAAARVRRT